MSSFRLLAVECLLMLLTGCAMTGSKLAPMEMDGLCAGDLQMEHLTNPCGLDRPAPRFGWIVVSRDSNARDKKQAAYQIIVSDSPDEIRQGVGKLWDSGKVSSEHTVDIAYTGSPLRSHEQIFWAVRVWDEKGCLSDWSSPAMFSTGFLPPEAWIAPWIGCDLLSDRMRDAEPSLRGADWISAPVDAQDQQHQASAIFEMNVDVANAHDIARAVLCADADSDFEFWVNDRQVEKGATDLWRAAQVADITNALVSGQNHLRARVENKHGSAPALIARIKITWADGHVTEAVTGAGWKVHAEGITATRGKSNQFTNANVLGPWGVEPWGQVRSAQLLLPPTILVRHEFTAPRPIRRATAYFTALGLADLYINGTRVSDDLFNPGWTDYSKRIYYRAYDVTSRIKPGANALGAVIAGGWFSDYMGYENKRDMYGKKTRVAISLRLEYADGSVDTVQSSPEWKATAGPTTAADLLMGESYDARKELRGWTAGGFDDSAWIPVDVGTDEVHPVIQWHPGPPVRPYETFAPLHTNEVSPGVWVMDLGQNFAGFARLKLPDTTPGQKITLRFAERLNPDGTIYTLNLRGARATDTYICRGAREEDWQPRFTFHGFQYIEVTGLSRPPQRDTVTGVAIGSDTPLAGTFDTSDAMLNRLHKNIYYTQRSNFIDVPTDCPQRDERLGWMADAQVYVQAAALNTDVHAFMDKWLIDIMDAQRKDGEFPMVAPLKVSGDDGGPAWADAGTIIPWTLYKVYGDRELLARQYPSMRRFIEFCRQRSTPDLLPPKSFASFGDWLSINADTPKDVIYLAYFAQSTRLTMWAAQALGKAQDAEELQSLYNQIKSSFNRAYVSADGRIKGDTQACYALAIAFGLVDGSNRELAAKYLVENIQAHGWHLSTGFLGTKELMPVLSEIGRADVAYRLLHNDTFPSWGFSIRQGATSIWERWDGWTPQKGFQNPGMNSFAHYSFGAVYRWMVEAIGGIHEEGIGFQKIVLAPELDPLLTHAQLSYRSIHGNIISSWHRQDGKLDWLLTIPANVSALVVFPSKSVTDIQESGKFIQSAGFIVESTPGRRISIHVGSGIYRFQIANPLEY